MTARFGYGHYLTSDPEHDALMVHHVVGRLHRNINGAGRFLDRLRAAIDEGASIAFDSVTARQLEDDARTLMTLAGLIAESRTALIENATPRLTLVAAE
jgi:hypothetical protein